MKKIFIVALLGMATLARAQTVTIDFTLGTLTNANGTTPIADGMLIQVIAAPTTGGLVAPTPTAFTSGSEILLWSVGFDSTTIGTTGVMDIFLDPVPSSTLPAGYALMVQWFPTLAFGASAPGYSTPYGQYSTLNDVSWVAPASGSNVSFSYLNTLSGLGSQSNSLGVANLTTAAIPEPSTYAAIFGALALGFVAYRRRSAA